MNVTLTVGLAAALLAAGGCASRAWRWAETGTTSDYVLGDMPPALPAHRAVERVTLHIGGHELEFVGYRACDPKSRDVRAQLLLDSGISAIDVEVHGAESRRVSGSAFEAIPNFAATAMDDLRRTWGSRSVFGVRFEFVSWTMDGGNFSQTMRLVRDGDRTFPTEPLDDGSWLAVAPGVRERIDPLHVTLLDRDLVPEATIDYSDFDADGVPREIRLVDYVHPHTLDVEVEEVRLVAGKSDAVPAK